MRNVFLAAGLLLFLSACGAPQEAAAPMPSATPAPIAAATPTAAESPIPTPEPPDHVDYLVTVGQDQYTVRMVGVPGQYIRNENTMILKEIDIYRGEEAQPFQVLTDLDAAMVDGAMPMYGAFLVQDVNFDGWTDFCYEELDYRGNLHLVEMLWDPAAGIFHTVEDDAFFATNPVYDSGTKLVYGLFSSGLSGYTRTVYRWEGRSKVKVCAFMVDGYDELKNTWYTAGDETPAKTWEGAIGGGPTRILPGAEPYKALTSPPREVADPAPGVYSVWRLVDMGADRPLYAAKLTSHYTDVGPGEQNNSLTQIDLYTPDDLERPFQSIPLEGNTRQLDLPVTDFGLTVEDLNFDGWPDLRMGKWLGAYTWGSYYLIYDPIAGRFERNLALEETGVTDADPEHKTLRDEWRSADTNYTDLYRWIGDRPVLVRRVEAVWPSIVEESLESDRDYTVFDFVNGTLVEVKRCVNPRLNGGAAAFVELNRWKTDPDYHGEA